MKKILLILLSLGVSCAACLAGCSNKPSDNGSPEKTRIIEVDENGDKDENSENECPDGKCGKKRMPCPKRGRNGKNPTDGGVDRRGRRVRKPPALEDMPNG